MKDVKLDYKTKGILTLLIHEIQEVLNNSKTDEMDKLTIVEERLEHWIKANDLHPERVKTIPKEYVKRVEMGDQKVWNEIFKWYEAGK